MVILYLKHKEVVHMQVIKRTLGALRRLSRKQLFVAGAFTLALAGAVSLGIATKQSISAASVVRECEHNSIDYKNYNGGCGAANPAEYVADLRTNDPADLQVSAKNFNAGFHLDPSEYNKFASTAQAGMAYKDGTVVVNGQTVLTNAWSIGRDHFSYASAYSIPGDGTTYWASKSQDVFAVNAIPVMVMFDNTGAVQFIAMNPCGNLMGGTKVVPKYGCTMLNKTAVSGKQNTYTFTSNAFATNNAAITKVTYAFGDGTNQTVSSPSTPVTHTYTKPGNYTASVTVSVSLPGGNSATTPVVANCQTQITVVAPYYACSALLATALDDKNQQFRFTVKANYGNGATLQSADFTVDNKATTTGVTTKDQSGNIYKDYTFTDGADHTVVAKVNFNIAGSVTSVTCQAKVTSGKTPMCTVPGKENLPPNSPQCFEECKPGIPVGSPSCNETPTPPPASELPNTGAGNVIGIFGGTTALGAAGHRLFLSRRRRR